MELVIELGKRLKMIRSYSGIKQKDLATKLNVKPSVLSMYEQGKREPSISFLNKYCNLFEISLSHLFAFQKTNLVNELNSEHIGIINDLSNLLKKVERENIGTIQFKD